MTEAALRGNPNRWPVPMDICRTVADEIMEARQEGANTAIQIALEHGVLGHPTLFRAERGDGFTSIPNIFRRTSEGFAVMIAADSSHDESEDGRFVMVGIHAHP